MKPILELASQGGFRTAPADAYVDLHVRGHVETHAVRGNSARRWIVREYFTRYGTPPPQEVVKDAISLLEARALFDGPEREVFTRVGRDSEGAVYLDLADPDWRCVRIDGSGWTIESTAPVRFRRAPGMLQIPPPIRGGSIDSLRDLLNLSGSQQFALVVGWLIAALRPQGPYPALVINGEQGSAKSTAARLIRRLIDPNKAELRSIPREERDLVIAAANGWVIALDNVSSLRPWLSDALCRLSTGGGFSTRRLYTDDEEQLFDVTRPLILNGIESFATRGDLLDRALVLPLPPIDPARRLTENELWRRFDRVWPSVLGALLDAASAALRNLDQIQLRAMPRMADVARWVTASETALEWPSNTFVRAFDRSQADSNLELLEEDPVAGAVIELASRGRWIGTASELLSDLEATMPPERHRDRSWPQSPRGMGGRIRRLAPALRRAGYYVNFYRESDSARRKLIEIGGNGPNGPEPSSDLRVRGLLDSSDSASAGCRTGRDRPREFPRSAPGEADDGRSDRSDCSDGLRSPRLKPGGGPR